jgi:hypothetical protein
MIVAFCNYSPKWNELLNSYNPLQILGWRPNADFTPYVSRRSVDIHISKYFSKKEVKSELYGLPAVIVKLLLQDIIEIKIVWLRFDLYFRAIFTDIDINSSATDR